ncbi:MAG: cyclic nucleotide-binding domain-containing protein [Chloroflexi bacterium]|nr:cyclic nucleotide-binding domain-containing protein [Chloroflexota bacterium]
MDNLETRVQFLSQVPLFHSIHPEDLAELGSQMTELSYPPGAVIIKEGAPGDGLYVIARGQVKVTGKGPGNVEAALATLEPGDSFGELALLDGYPRSATITAAMPTQCLYLPREVFLVQVTRHPQIAIALLPVLAERLREADRLILQLNLRLASPLAYRLWSRGI